MESQNITTERFSYRESVFLSASSKNEWCLKSQKKICFLIYIDSLSDGNTSEQIKNKGQEQEKMGSTNADNIRTKVLFVFPYSYIRFDITLFNNDIEKVKRLLITE